MLDECLKSLEADSSAADPYLFLISDRIKFIEEERIAKTNQKEMELSSSGLKLASQAG